MAPCNGTQQWHHVHSPKLGRHLSPAIAHYNGTLQWHPAMAPRPLTQTWSSPSPPTIPHHNGTLQWHPAMAPSSPSPPTIAHYNGIQQWHHIHFPKVGRHPPPNHSTLQWHPMAPSNGTLRLHPAMAPGPLHPGTLVPRPIRQSGSSPSPLLEVRTPIAIAIWGKRTTLWCWVLQRHGPKVQACKRRAFLLKVLLKQTTQDEHGLDSVETRLSYPVNLSLSNSVWSPYL